MRGSGSSARSGLIHFPENVPGGCSAVLAWTGASADRTSLVFLGSRLGSDSISVRLGLILMRERLQDHALWLVVSRWLRLGSLSSGWRRRLTRSSCLPAQAARRRPARTALRYRRASTADINGPCRICRPVGVPFKSSSGCVASAVVKRTVPGACSQSALSQRSPLPFQDGRNGWKGSCIVSAWHWVGAPGRVSHGGWLSRSARTPCCGWSGVEPPNQPARPRWSGSVIGLGSAAVATGRLSATWNNGALLTSCLIGKRQRLPRGLPSTPPSP